VASDFRVGIQLSFKRGSLGGAFFRGKLGEDSKGLRAWAEIQGCTFGGGTERKWGRGGGGGLYDSD